MTGPVSTMPHVRALSAADIRASLDEGLADLRAAPGYGLTFGVIAALFGIAIVACVTWLDIPWMIYPFAIGFPLVGPFMAVGLYEVSRRLEAGQSLSWRGIWQVIWAQRGRELSWMAFVMLFVFWVWVYQVRLRCFWGGNRFPPLAGLWTFSPRRRRESRF
jgi:uncharacterized membrane protein